ncbi:MAG: hypothetical protein K6U87_16865, partial [Firmicutes bacterium]|nr:hypothetical protein [Bacillota bacterium]
KIPHPHDKQLGNFHGEIGDFLLTKHILHDVEAPIHLALFCETRAAPGTAAESWPWPDTEVGVGWTFRWDPRQRAVDLADLQVYLADPDVPAFRIACQEPHPRWPQWRETQPRLHWLRITEPDRWLVVDGVSEGRGTLRIPTTSTTHSDFTWLSRVLYRACPGSLRRPFGLASAAGTGAASTPSAMGGDGRGWLPRPRPGGPPT